MEEESQKTEFDEFKQKIFNFTYELVTNEISLGVYIFLIILENLQFIGYYSNGNLTINTVGFDYFRRGVKFINLLQFLKDYNINVYLVPFFFILNIIHVVLFVIGYKAYQKRTQSLSRSVSDRNFHKNKVEYFINLLMIGYTTVLTIPIFQTSVTSFYCSAGNPLTNKQDCYVGGHVLMVMVGVMNCVWLFVVNVYYAMYYFNRNPFSQGFMTCSSNWFNLGKFLVKIIPMIYMMYDPSFQFPVLFLIIMNIAYLGYLVFFSKFLFKFYRYNFRLEKINIAIEFFVCLFNIHFILVYVFQDQDGQPNLLTLAWAAMSFLFSIIVVDIAGRMKRSLLQDINSTDKKKLPQILEYLIYLINDTEYKFKQNKGVFFVSNIAKTHKQLCDNPKCYCNIYFAEQKKPGYNKKLWVFYTLMVAIIDRIIKQNKKAYPFFILKAYILFYKMQSQIKAATTISQVMSDKLDFSDDMLVKGLLFQLNQQYSDTRDMEIYRKFNEHLLQQEDQSLVLTQLYMTYWDELIDQKSSISKLQLIIHKIKKSKQTIQTVVDGALSIFHNHVRVLLLYKNLLKEVMNDYLGSIRCEERYKIGLKENKLSNVDTVNKIQFRQNENLLVLNLTRNYSNPNETMGKYKVISISSNVKEFLGFTNTQLKGQSINKLIPRVYHSIHDEFIDNMLDRRNSQIQSKQIRIFPMTSNGCIIECNLISKFMPSITYGINIVSFMEQCDKEKDQFFIIYNSNTGIVDSMTIQAQMLLKDQSFRNSSSDVLSIPDNINDLLPNWDYRQQSYRDRSKRSKSAKTISHLNESNLNVRNIQLYRSDGIGNKFIKVLKFKSSFLTKMLSLQNQSYKQSNTIQKYLEHRREMTITGMSEYDKVEKMDTSQIQGVIRFDTSKVFDRQKEKKKTLNSLLKIQNEKAISIDETPPSNYRLCFIGIQIVLILAALSVSSIQIYTLFNNVKHFNDDINLIVDLNAIQSQLADTTYLFSLTLTQLAYTTTNISLPYPHRTTSYVNTTNQLSKIKAKFDLIDTLVKDANPLLIIKRENQELTVDQISMQAVYRKSQLTSDTYIKSQTIVQVVFQYIAYGEQILYTINDLHQTVQTILPSTNLYFIFVNSIKQFHKKMNTITQTLISDIENNLSRGVRVYLLVSFISSIIFMMSALITVLFYRYILNNYVLRVLAMYEKINIDKIKEYKDRCHRYKLALKGKDDKEKSSENIDKTLELINQTIGKQADNILIEPGIEEESKLLPQKKEEAQEEQEHFLSFQSKPALKKIICFMAIWIIIHGVLLISLLLSYKSQTSELQTAVQTLEKHAQTRSSMVHLRFYSHLSLNLLDYWNDTKLAFINEEVQEYIRDALVNINYTDLNLTSQRSFISAKYHQFALIRQMVLANNKTGIESKLKGIISTCQQINDLLQFLYNQTLLYETVALSVSQSMSKHLNIEIIATLLYISAFWILGIRYVYLKILQQHQITFEMYNIIGYNLRKEIESVK